ncbi:MAG: tRNA (adenosine(37)-N6)-threonylcarbamoyltransferase complex transferase subunit TsaD [Kiritimatiellae bacterium]|nr:tRNA (adenosine(37)-N6)-threonylcarbamoyltransferase complex transferase subunit TsaD [Kiritimatiellia bacterium]
MNILGIETSCDETAAAVVRDGTEVLSSITYSQIPLHLPYGGVVPEVAGRAHVAKIGTVIAAAIEGIDRIDAVAVTYGPGLAGALLVGLNAAKGFAAARSLPLVCVNHIEAHLHTPFLVDAAAIRESHNLGLAEDTAQAPRNQGMRDIETCMPALGLVVSGGHSTWLEMPRCGEYRLIGQTLDDAAGEAFDKAAKLLDLGYPGGPKIDRIAKAFWNSADFSAYSSVDEFMADAEIKKLQYPPSVHLPDRAPVFPKGNPREGTAALAGLDASLCVSFSGLKTALLRHVQAHPPQDFAEKAMLVAAYQEAIVASLADRTANALKRGGYHSLIVGGGVSLNARLRMTLARIAERFGVEFLSAKPKYCGDNAAMIAGLAYFRRCVEGEAAMAQDALPNLQTGV